MWKQYDAKHEKLFQISIWKSQELQISRFELKFFKYQYTIYKRYMCMLVILTCDSEFYALITSKTEGQKSSKILIYCFNNLVKSLILFNVNKIWKLGKCPNNDKCRLLKTTFSELYNQNILRTRWTMDVLERKFVI